MTIDKKQSPYKPKIYQGRSRNQNRNRQNFMSRDRSLSRGRSQGGNRGNYNYRNNYRLNYRNRSRGRWNNHRSGDRSNNYQTNNRQGNNQGDNPYKKVVLNKVFREEDKSPEMRNWSIFSDNVRYIQHEPKTPHKLDIDTLDYRQHKELYFRLKGEESETLDVDFGLYPDILKSKYPDVYEGVYAERCVCQ